MIVWRSVDGFALYEVSDRGTVRHARTRRRLAMHPNHNGYLRVTLLGADGRRHFRKVHHLVLHAFIGPRPSALHHGAHGPGGQKNNRASNLRWALPVENEADKKLTGTARNGGLAKARAPDEVEAIRARARAGESYSSIAKSLRMHRHSVSRICRGLRHAPRAA